MLIAMPFGICHAQDSAFMARSDDYYQSLHLSKTTIEPWEDGMRTTGGKGSYEWWYFDATLSNGSTLVIAFYTKDFTLANKPMHPSATFELTRPDGTKISKEQDVAASDFSASKEHCDVKLGVNTFNGDLHDYTIHIDIDDVKADIQLHGTVPSWRPNTGHVIFKEKRDEHYFAWLPSVPQGDVKGTIAIAGKTEDVTGVGYHDHNWGDVSMMKLIHDWYWGRGQVGNYSIIASHIIAADKYNNNQTPIFMLARDGKIIADDFTKIKFSTSDVYTDAHTGKPVANNIVYDFNDNTSHYRVTFKRERDIVNTRFIDDMHGLTRMLAKLADFDGAYLRFTGQVTVERFDGDKLVETATNKAAVWEMMYFGHAPKK
jgi:hypothetical protein